MSYTSKIDSCNFDSIFASRLRSLMQEKGYLQKDLASFVGVTQQAISAYMRGESTPKVGEAAKIARFFDVSVNYLIGISDIQSSDEIIYAINKITGLSESAILCLIKEKKEFDSYIEFDITKIANSQKNHMDFISSFASNQKHFHRLVDVIEAYGKYYCNGISDADFDISLYPYAENVSISARALFKQHISDLFFEMIQQYWKEGLANGKYKEN